MARAAKSISNESADWEEILALFREELRFYLDYLIQCKCDHQILAKVEAEVREQSVPDEFKHRFLLRALARNAIGHLRECTLSGVTSLQSAQESQESVACLTPQERLVYFMRDILEYSTRNSSLLMGATDAQVERLLVRARKRIDRTEGPSSLEIETRQGTYFRWKFVDLHLS
jgi:DNA-directed RNA polymerase specialized sigma24 family protein